MPTIAELITAYRDRTGTPSYEVMARKVRNEILANRLHQLHTTPPKSFAEARTMELLAELLEVPVSTIVLAYASSLGIPVRDVRPELARRLPPGTESLTDHDLDAVITVIRALVGARNQEAHGAGHLPPVPTVDELDQDEFRLAARRGTSEGRRLREQQDTDAES